MGVIKRNTNSNGIIYIRNLRNAKPKHPWDFGIHRRTPVGNPYFMSSEAKRDQVCDQYEDWFHYAAHDKEFHSYLNKLFEAYKKYNKLQLFCWCSPKRCHGETIRDYIKERYEEELS